MKFFTQIPTNNVLRTSQTANTDEEGNLYRAGQDPDDYYGRIPAVDWDAKDNYGYAWNEKTVKAHARANHDFIYPSMLDKNDLSPKLVELDEANEIGRKSEQQIRQDYPEEFLSEDPDDPETAVDWTEVRDRLVNSARNSWYEGGRQDMLRPFGRGYPPVVVRRTGDSSFDVIDGNHRVSVWQDSDRIDLVPAWVVDDYIAVHAAAKQKRRKK